MNKEQLKPEPEPASYFIEYQSMIESDSSTKSIKEVEAENNKLRGYLKDLNEKLTKYVEASMNAQPKKFIEFKKK